MIDITLLHISKHSMTY